MAKQGKAFENEVFKSLKHYENKIGPLFVCDRINDTSDYRVNWFCKCGKFNKSNLVLPIVPADFIFTYDGKTTYLEAKSSMAVRYQLDWIKDHQINDLIRRKQAKCEAFFMFGYRASLAKRRKKKTVFDTNKAWLIAPEDILRLKIDNIVSLSWDEINSLGTEVKREHSIWKILNI